MSLIKRLEHILLGVQATTDAEAITLFSGVTGRGPDQYNSKLARWLELNADFFPEQIEAKVTDHFSELGTDVLLTGLATKSRIGFQTKSDNDLKKKGFIRDTKAQITESRSWSLSLYVIILHCSPTEKNRQRYMYLINELGRAPNDYVLVIEPQRAAGLLKAFDTNQIVAAPPRYSWSDFFIAINRPDLYAEYIDPWKNALPDERFEPPAEFNKLMESVANFPLTLLIGPPAVGKTFSAMQVLWQEYHRDRDIEWIAPMRFLTSEGVIPDLRGVRDMKQRIDYLASRLGIVRNIPPLDPTDFIAKYLRPNNVIYIEDPFGKIDDEFNTSLHTYTFFDLNRFVDEIASGANRSGCRLLITTREALFERWLDESKQKGTVLPAISTIHMTSKSYTDDQCLSVARCLIHTRDVREVEAVSRIIAKYSDVPFDAEVIVRDLPSDATIEDAERSASKSIGDHLTKLENRIVAESNAERLFLLLMVAWNGWDPNDVKHNDFPEALKSLRDSMGFSDALDELFGQARTKYRSIISQREVVVMEPLNGMVNLVTRNDEDHYSLEPIHSIVVDVIRTHLQATAKSWLEFVATSLSKKAVGIGGQAQSAIAFCFIRWQMFETMGIAAQDGVLNAIFDEDRSTFLRVPSLMASWESLPLRLKQKFFTLINDDDSLLKISEVCGLLNILQIPEQDAWQFTRLLLEKHGLGFAGVCLNDHPWQYLADRLERIPTDIKERLDHIAEDQPDVFTYALAQPLIGKWKDLPDQWRAAFQHPAVLVHKQGRLNLFCSIAANWENAPDELRKVFVESAHHERGGVRAAVAIAAIINRNSCPTLFESIFMASIRDEDPSVPLRVLAEGVGVEDHDRRFCEAFYAEGKPGMIAALLNHLINVGEPKSEWQNQLASKCLAEGGEFSAAVLTYHCLTHGLSEFMGFRLLPLSPTTSDLTRLAWFWAYVNCQRKQIISDGEAIDILTSLSAGNYRRIALGYLAVQSNYLQHSLDYYLEKIGPLSTEDFEFINDGSLIREEHDSKSQTIYGFPTFALISDTSKVREKMSDDRALLSLDRTKAVRMEVKFEKHGTSAEVMHIMKDPRIHLRRK